MANFRLIAAIPLYLSFVFGFIRDTSNPFGMADRGYMLLFGFVTAALYVVFAFVPVSYATLLGAITLLTASYLFVASAQQGLTSTIGQQHAMAGQISAVWSICRVDPGDRSASHRGLPQQCARRTEAPADAARILFLTGATTMMAGDGICRVEAAKRLRQRPGRTRLGWWPNRGPQSLGEALAAISGAADLAAVEFCSGRGDTFAILSSGRPARE